MNIKQQNKDQEKTGWNHALGFSFSPHPQHLLLSVLIRQVNKGWKRGLRLGIIKLKGWGAKNSRRGVNTQIYFNPSFLKYL